MTAAERLKEQMLLLMVKGLWFAASVVSVDEEQLLVEIDPLVDDIDNKTISLLPMNGPPDGWYCIPSLGSTVAVAKVDDQSYGILFYGEIDKWVSVVNEAKLELTADGVVASRGNVKMELGPSGVKIQRGSESLGSILDDLVTAIKTLTVTCASPGTPSSPPVNLPTFNAIAVRLGQVLV